MKLETNCGSRKVIINMAKIGVGSGVISSTESESEESGRTVPFSFDFAYDSDA